MKKHILVVEDDAHIRLGLVATLESEHFTVSETGDGRQALALARERKPDLILLDIMLPGKSGYDVCRELRQQKISTPVIMLTAKGQEIDKVVGLELGADDYVTKPFGVRELVARIQAVLRRVNVSGGDADGEPLPPVIEFGKVRIDTASLRGARGKMAMELSPRELRVLALLWRERGKVVTRDDLLNKVWGVDYYGTTRTLDQVMVKLRQKIEDKPEEPRHLLTVYGLGYRLDE